MTQTEINYTSFLNLSVKEYPNKWVALVDGKVITSKKVLKKPMKKQKKNSHRKDR